MLRARPRPRELRIPVVATLATLSSPSASFSRPPDGTRRRGVARPSSGGEPAPDRGQRFGASSTPWPSASSSSPSLAARGGRAARPVAGPRRRSAVALKQVVVAFVADSSDSRGAGGSGCGTPCSRGPFLLLVSLCRALPGRSSGTSSLREHLRPLGWYYLLRLAGVELPFPPVFVSYAALLAGVSSPTASSAGATTASREPPRGPRLLRPDARFAPRCSSGARVRARAARGDVAALYTLFGMIVWATSSG